MKYKIHNIIKIRFLFIIAFTLFNLQIYSQKNTLHVIENKNCVQTKTFKNADLNYYVNHFAEKLKLAYIRKGYIACSIDSITWKTNNASIFLNKGFEYKFGKLSCDFNCISSKTELKPNRSANFKKIEKFESNILSYYRSHGYLNAQLSKNTEFDSAIINLNYHLEQNDQFFFDSIVFDKKLISYNYISRFTGLRLNEPANYLKLQNLNTAFKQNQIFSLDSLKITYSKKKVKAHLHLKQNKKNSFNGILGIQSNKQNKVEATGKIELSLANTLKQGEKIIFEWNKTNPLSQQLHIAATFPYIYKTPIGIKADFELRKQDSSYTNTNIMTGLLIPFSNWGELSVNVLSRNSIINTKTDSIFIKSSKAILYGLGYNFYSFNNFTNPSSGWLLETSILLGQKNNDYSNNSSYKSLQSEAQLLIQRPIKLPYGNIFLSSNSGIILNDSLNANNLYPIGGIKNLRGFNENSIFAKSYAIFSCEGRLSIDSESYVYLFYDLGFTNELSTYNFLTNKRQAFGLGLKLNTKAGLVHISYALGKLNSENYNIKSGKIHIGYVNKF
ncbi:MAG: hypothetical protein JEZ09_02485 [Salinivirgaceae bacterium]|nr:hypothetical protein [Salinivirgaceae bacterium]